MKKRRMRLMAIFAAGVLSVTSMGGIVTAHAEETLSVPAEEAGAGAVQMDGKDAQAAEDGSVAASEGLIAGSFKPSEIAQPAQDTYEYPFLGMKLGISKDLKEQMEKKNISMFTDERWNDNADAVTYATASWCTLTDEQKDAEVDKMGTGYDDWLKSLSRVGVIGMYDEESQKDLDRITGCTEHKELGTSSDGKYKYYLSTNKDADADVTFIEERSPQIIAEYRSKLEEKVKEFLEDSTIEENRIAAEVTLYADKIAVDEEIVRLQSHISSMTDVLESDESIGRKLDFMAQEMNREANTILSKSSDVDLADHAIELKTNVEKVREQIQNIE